MFVFLPIWRLKKTSFYYCTKRLGIRNYKYSTVRSSCRQFWLAETIIIVPDFTISVYSSSCNYSIYFLTFAKRDGMSWNRQQKMRDRSRRRLYGIKWTAVHRNGKIRDYETYGHFITLHPQCLALVSWLLFLSFLNSYLSYFLCFPRKFHFLCL